MARVSSRLSAVSNRLYRIVVFPSDMPPKEPPRVRPAARAVLLALAVAAVPALAQNADPPLAQGGAPRSIVPPIILAPRPPLPDRPTAPPQEPGQAPVDSVVG